MATSLETKRQHFLPFSYLKHFRCNQEIDDRGRATIYRDNGANAVKELAAQQCYKNWYYRRSNTQESEAGFGKFEADWNEVLDRTRSGHREDALCFLQMVMYHFRNLSIRYQVDSIDRYDLVQAAVVNFVEQKILRLPKGVNFTDDPSQVTQFPWEVRLVTFSNPMLLTSDNPSVMTVSPDKDGYAPFFLPVSPTELMVAVDNKRYRFTALSGSNQDGFYANFFVAAQGMRFVYYHAPMSPSQRKSLWDAIDIYRIPESARGNFKDQRFVPSHPIFDPNRGHSFSFLERIS